MHFWAYTILYSPTEINAEKIRGGPQKTNTMKILSNTDYVQNV